MNNLWVVGDSTLSEFDDKYYYPRYGYGTRLHCFLSDKIQVKNLALSGRSSLSFTKEENYKKLLEGISKGDFLLIGFGHNDEKTEKDRFTSPVGDYKEEGTFANSLYTRYIEVARKVGATPILCTPIVRRKRGDNWESEELHITKATADFLGGDYALAVRKLADDTKTPIIDMTSMTKVLYERIGCEASAYLHAWTSNKMVSVDDTHTNIWGGTVNAFLVMKAIANMGIDGLSECVINLDNNEPIPSKEDYLVANPDYVPTVFDANLKDSEYFKEICDFKGTVFGDVETEDFGNGDFVIEEIEDGLGVHLAVKNNHGKIAKSSDGIAMCYKQIETGKNFTLKATMKVNDFFYNDQVSFGLMVRDDIYIDKKSSDVLGDYVAAAPLLLTHGEETWSCFARRNGERVQGSEMGKTIKPGDKLEVYLSSSNDGYTAKLGDGPYVSGGFDFKLTAVDPEHVYVGFFVSRNADVTFTNIEFDIR